MKPIILLSILVLSVFSVRAQDNETTINDSKKNEIKINGLYLVLGAVEVTYERLINEESGVGISVFLPLDNDIKDDIDYYISPYYRMYFGKKYASGFFVEGFGLLSSVKENKFSFIEGDVFVIENNVTDFALGIGIGGKWITKRGFLAELNFGVGRNLFNGGSNEDFVGKIGITLGYRFK